MFLGDNEGCVPCHPAYRRWVRTEHNNEMFDQSLDGITPGGRPLRSTLRQCMADNFVDECVTGSM